MRQRVDYCNCWLTIVITSLALSLQSITANEQLINDDSQKVFEIFLIFFQSSSKKH